MKNDVWCWMSFVERDRESGDRFLGAVILEADSHMNAIIKAHAYGINPGGEVLIVECDAPPEGFAYRLLSKDEAISLKEMMDDQG